jgi:alpha-beta hydrolase superfamily lysophospholipase
MKLRRIASRVGLSTLVLLAIVAVAALVTAPRALVDNASAVSPGEPLDEWIARNEASVQSHSPIVAGTEKRILWFDPETRAVTDTAVIYIHGFSASRGEISPVPERVAKQLGANLFETRLAGHGIRDTPLTGVKAENWLDDAAEALAIGGRIGRRIVIIATSTGATLTLAISGRDEMRLVDAIVMISPNFALPDPASEILTWPGGPQFAQLTVGSTRSWAPQNELQARYWSTSYPTLALVEMMRLVKYTRSRLPLTLHADLLTLYSPGDAVVSADATRAALQKISAPRMQTIEILDSDDPGQHVLIGDILSPRITDRAVDTIVTFLSRR